MNRVPYGKLQTLQYGSGPEPADIRMHPQFPYFKAFYENQVQEIRTKMKVPPSNLPTAEFVPPAQMAPKAPIVPPQPPVPNARAPIVPPQVPNARAPPSVPMIQRAPPAQNNMGMGSRMPGMGSRMPSMGPQMLMSGVPGLGLLQMLNKPKSGGGGQSKLSEIQKHGLVKRNPPLSREDEYLLQQYKRPRIRPDLKLHGMINEQEFQPRAFRESDIPQLNPYALVSDDGSGYEVGKLYAYERKSF